MPEQLYDKKVFSLLEVTNSIRNTLASRYTSSFWVKAEMNKLNYYKHSGHCYPELVEKKDGKIIAQIKAHLWKDDYQRINAAFQRVLKEPLKDGIKILFEARIVFDPVYGLSLWIRDIDPGYTLGDLEREKQETLERLRREGLFHKNKALRLPLLPQRIAIISVETSKGYADFLKVIDRNTWGYRFFHMLFPSLLQGDKAVQDITAQLRRIRKVQHYFDVVAITRGGGGDVGLSCFNHYELAKELACFPLPVLTGIGHATNETVAEMVAHYNAITPTKLGEFLLQCFHNVSVPVQNAATTIKEKALRLLDEEQLRFRSEMKLFRSVAENSRNVHRNRLQQQAHQLQSQSRYILGTYNSRLRLLQSEIRKENALLMKENSLRLKQFISAVQKSSGARLQWLRLQGMQLQQRLLYQSRMASKTHLAGLQALEKNVANMSPENVLKRGYSITLCNGKAVTDITQVQPGNVLHTLIFGGQITSTVQKTDKATPHE
jgi:exodeoxyribonuclease VII large subunit